MELDTMDAVFTPHPSWYIGEDRARIEEERLLLKQWHFFCAASLLDSAGAVFSQRILNRPILARRSNDGAIRAFHNVCRHRGGPIVEVGKSKCKYLTCA